MRTNCVAITVVDTLPSFHSMPSFYSWEEVLTSPRDFSFNSTVVAGRDHHPPADGLAFPNPNAFQGQSEMTEAVQMWLPTPATEDSNQTFAQWCWSTQVFQSMVNEPHLFLSSLILSRQSSQKLHGIGGVPASLKIILVQLCGS